MVSTKNAFLVALVLLIGLMSFSAVSAAVVINEVLPNAPGTPEELEWLELYNTGEESVNLTGWTVSESSNDVTLDVIIPSEGFVIVARNSSEFNQAYTVSVPVVEFASMSLANSGETILLNYSNGTIADSVTYPSLAENNSYGRYLDGESIFTTYTYPTPGEALTFGASLSTETIIANSNNGTAHYMFTYNISITNLGNTLMKDAAPLLATSASDLPLTSTTAHAVVDIAPGETEVFETTVETDTIINNGEYTLWWNATWDDEGLESHFLDRLVRQTFNIDELWIADTPTSTTIDLPRNYDEPFTFIVLMNMQSSAQTFDINYSGALTNYGWEEDVIVDGLTANPTSLTIGAEEAELIFLVVDGITGDNVQYDLNVSIENAANIFQSPTIVEYTITSVAGNTAPTAFATDLPEACFVGQNCTFDGSASEFFNYDVDDELTYKWIFDSTVTKIGQIVQYEFPAASPHTAELTVTDEDGLSSTESYDIAVFQPQPDLTSGISAPSTAVLNSANTITVTITNAGGEDVNQTFAVQLFDGTILLKTWNITALNQSASTTLTQSWTPIAAGEHTLKVVVDTENTINETLETNNQATQMTTVAAPGAGAILNVVPTTVSLIKEVTNTEATVSSTFQINNSGADPLSNIAFTFTNLSMSVGDTTEIIENSRVTFTSPGILAAGASGNATVTITVPRDRNVDAYGTYTATVTATSGSSSDTFALSLRLDSEYYEDSIVIKGIKIDDDKLFRTESTDIEFTLDNNLNVDLEDITVTLEIPELDISEEVTSNIIKDGKDETFTVTVTIPEDANEQIYALRFYVDAIDENGDDLTYYDSKADTLRVSVDTHDLVVVEVIASDEVQCGESIDIGAKIANIGSSDEDEVSIRLQNRDLKFDQTKILGTLDTEDITTIMGYKITIPANTPAGTYLIAGEVSYKKDSKQGEDSHLSNFASLKVTCGAGSAGVGGAIISGTSTQISQRGESVRYEMTLTNTQSSAATYRASISGVSDWGTASVEPTSDIQLAAGQSLPVYVYVTPKGTAAAGNHSATLQVYSGTTLVTSKTLTTDLASGVSSSRLGTFGRAITGGATTDVESTSNLIWGLIAVIVVLIAMFAITMAILLRAPVTQKR